MSDQVRDADAGDEDRLPWLEAVEDGDGTDGPPIAKLIAAIVIGLLAIGLVVGGLFWLGNRNRDEGNGEIIAAPEGDYKVRPDQPGGMDVAGSGETAQAASEGAEPKGRLNTDNVPESPAARPAAPSRGTAVSGRPAPAPAAIGSSGPAAASGPVIQLGAFSNQAGASRAWTAMAARFRYLAPLRHSVLPVQAGGRTLYRLRASGPDAAGLCQRLRVAGEDCTLVN